MARMYLGRPDWMAGATFVPSATGDADEVGGFEVENLAKVHFDDRYQASTTDPAIILDCGEADRDWIAVGLLYHSLGPSDTWRIRSADTEANLTSSPSYDTNSLGPPLTAWATDDFIDDGNPTKHSFHKAATMQTDRWMRIDISAAATGTNFGRLMICSEDPWVDRSIAPGSGFTGLEDRTRRGISNQGALTTSASAIKKAIPFRATPETPAVEVLLTMYEDRGSSLDFLVCRDPAATTRWSMGLFSGFMDLQLLPVQQGYNLHEVRGSLREM
jgi:hypothetical protein